MSVLINFRAAKDEYLAKDHHSPLTQNQKQLFEGLEYFPENPDLKLELEVEEFPTKDEIQMQTSTGDIQIHTRYGKIRFQVAGEDVELTLYKDAHGYFLPFVDSLAGKETYGAGRYLEPQQLPNGRVLVDFNYAYNPYCAYNDLYSCPLTPWENRLQISIAAGEKLPSGEWAKAKSNSID
ncbi:MAG: DUF1684 domain-containing protein [Chloroflexota bacterium]|nr:MAG: DUF1684 domain-containing protein [Chloroflexota bacterium]